MLSVITLGMDKLKLTGRKLGRVRTCFCICRAVAYITKWPNLKLQTQPKQLLGYLPLAFVLPVLSVIILGVIMLCVVAPSEHLLTFP
jgi:hypothetical protein